VHDTLSQKSIVVSIETSKYLSNRDWQPTLMTIDYKTRYFDYDEDLDIISYLIDS